MKFTPPTKDYQAIVSICRDFQKPVGITNSDSPVRKLWAAR